MIKIIIIVLILLVILFFSIYLIRSKNKLKEYFKTSVIVYGIKGSGKDLLFQKVINLNKKKEYFSNINYGFKHNKIEIKDISVSPNTYNDFIIGNIKKIERNEKMEGKDIFISDCGVFLPSTYDSTLNKTYPSFPIYYALSRHLYNQNIHCNTQNLERVWKQLREQADKYIRCIKTIKIFNLFFIKVRFYDKYESAKENLLPMNNLLLNKVNKALIQQYNATHGEIRNGLIVIRKKNIKYNTRYFKNVIFK